MNRMCGGCRKLYPRTSLIKIVLKDKQDIFIDKTYKQDGRGCYVCKNNQCFTIFKKKKVLERSFKKKKLDEIYADIEEEIQFFGK
ncbi:MAG: YlxR family protein [Oscillospiraceae bacterium]|nr:YlxR family protein [Oscillospiraceae bacterium]